jgi:hypothetical protein
MNSISSGNYGYSSFGSSKSDGDDGSNAGRKDLSSSDASRSYGNFTDSPLLPPTSPDVQKAMKLKTSIDSLKNTGVHPDEVQIIKRSRLPITLDEFHHADMKAFVFNTYQLNFLKLCVSQDLGSAELVSKIFGKIKVTISASETIWWMKLRINDCKDITENLIKYLEVFETETFCNLSGRTKYDLIIDAIDEFIAEKEKEPANPPSSLSSSPVSARATTTTVATILAAATAANAADAVKTAASEAADAAVAAAKAADAAADAALKVSQANDPSVIQSKITRASDLKKAVEKLKEGKLHEDPFLQKRFNVHRFNLNIEEIKKFELNNHFVGLIVAQAFALYLASDLDLTYEILDKIPLITKIDVTKQLDYLEHLRRKLVDIQGKTACIPPSSEHTPGDEWDHILKAINDFIIEQQSKLEKVTTSTAVSSTAASSTSITTAAAAAATATTSRSSLSSSADPSQRSSSTSNDATNPEILKAQQEIDELEAKKAKLVETELKAKSDAAKAANKRPPLTWKDWFKD